MATIADNLTFRTVGAMQPGELFRGSLKDGGVVCIRTEINRGGLPVVCAVKYGGKGRHTVEPVSHDTTGISYGSDWVLEPILSDDSFPGSTFAGDGYGVLWMDGSGATLTCYSASRDDNADAMSIDIVKGSERTAASPKVPVRHWRIWASEADRNRPGARPVLEFGAD